MGPRYAVIQHRHHFSSRGKLFEPLRFLVDTGKLEAGL
jgi:hypothetical protein